MSAEKPTVPIDSMDAASCSALLKSDHDDQILHAPLKQIFLVKSMGSFSTVGCTGLDSELLLKCTTWRLLSLDGNFPSHAALLGQSSP